MEYVNWDAQHMTERGERPMFFAPEVGEGWEIVKVDCDPEEWEPTPHELVCLAQADALREIATAHADIERAALRRTAPQDAAAHRETPRNAGWSIGAFAAGIAVGLALTVASHGLAYLVQIILAT